VDNVSIEPSSEFSFKVNSLGVREINGVFTSRPADSKISMRVLNPDKSIIWEAESVKTTDKQFILLNFMNPNPKASLEVIITNLSNQKVTVSGGMHDVPEPLQDEYDLEGLWEVFWDLYLYVIFASLLKFVGIVVGIIGTIVFFKERTKQNNKETLS
ncbi:MAG: hypothetical protein ACE5RG_09695, partial [Candidatus Nitrosomaritimum yanchengensis]